VVGNGFQGDIALDDVTVAPGPCGGDGKQTKTVSLMELLGFKFHYNLESC